MARIAGVDLPPNKRAEVGLTYIYGIGRSRSSSILKEAAVNLDTRVRDLSEDELSRIRAILEAQGEIEGVREGFVDAVFGASLPKLKALEKWNERKEIQHRRSQR